MSRAKKVVAIVDNEEFVRRALKRLFRARGIDTEGFSSGDSFLRFLDVRRPDCVILGRRMPEAGGFDVLLRMAAADLHIPVIVLTGRDNRSLRKRRRLAVVKPFPASAEARRLVRKRASFLRANQLGPARPEST